MKRLLLLTSITLLLSACTPGNKENVYKEKEAKVAELEKELQSTEVQNKLLKADIEFIGEEIARIERDSKDENITQYRDAVDRYAKAISREIESLKDQTTYYEKTDIINLENIKDIESHVNEIISDYEKDTEKLKLSNTLSRQDKKIEVFNDSLKKNLAEVTKAYTEKDKDTIMKALEQLYESVRFL